ncbi:MAG: nuclear transport factor 2 family protein [Pseudomonadota bacterium]
MEDRLQYLLDVHEIREISVLYNRYADASDGARFAALFTEDGEFDIVGARTFRGHEEIAAVADGSLGILHIAVDSIVEVDGDSATQTSKLIVGKFSPDRTTLDLIGTTTMRDVFVRQPDGWRIRKRQSHLDTDPAATLARLAVHTA